MPLNISANFKNDIQSKDTALVPVVSIDVVGGGLSDYIILSTGNHPIVDYSDEVFSNVLPLLLNIPSLKESVDIEKRNYKISSVNIDINNFPYNGKRFSELVTANSLINRICRIYFTSPSAKRLGHSDVYVEQESQSALHIFYGTIRKYTHDDEKARLVVEDRSQEMFHKDLPLEENYLTAPDVPDRYKNKPIPMVYGFVDKSPCVIASPLTEGDLGFEEESLTILLDSIPVNLTNFGLYIFDDYYYELAPTQDYSIFGLEGVYDNVPQLYVNGNVDNEVILKLSEEGGEKLTALAENNAHVTLEPKIQTLSVGVNTTDAVTEDAGGHGFVEGTGLTSDISVSGINSFINDLGMFEPLLINAKSFWIQNLFTYAQNIQISFSIKPIPTNIINRDIFRDNYLDIKPIWTTINPTGSIVATKYIGEIIGSDGFVFDNISTSTYDSGYPNLRMHFTKTGQFGDYTFSDFTSDAPEYFEIIEGFTEDDLIDPTSFLPNNLTVVFEVLDDPNVVDLSLELKRFRIKYELFVQDVFKSHLYAHIIGRASSFAGEEYLTDPSIYDPSVPDVIGHLMENELGYVTSYNEPPLYAGEYSHWGYAFTIDKKINSKKLIQDITSVSPYIPRFTNMGSFKLDIIPSNGSANGSGSDTTITSDDHIIKNTDVIDFSFSRTRIEDVYTKVIFKYNWDYARGEFNNTIGAEGDVFQIEDILGGYDFDHYGLDSDHSKSTLIIDDDRGKYIRSYETAVNFTLWYLMWICNQKLKMKIKLPLKYMFLEIGDNIKISNPDDGVLGGVKPYGIDYTVLDDVNGQTIFPNFLITATNKTLEWVEIECVQLPNLGDPITWGCMHDTACNYNPDATYDTYPTSCIYSDGQIWYEDADGDGIGDGNSPTTFCEGEDTTGWTTDCCDEDINCDCPANDETCYDCNGDCNGSAVIDECGVCGGGGIAEGDCDCAGNTLDDCGVCNGEGDCTPVLDIKVRIGINEFDVHYGETFINVPINTDIFIDARTSYTPDGSEIVYYAFEQDESENQQDIICVDSAGTEYGEGDGLICNTGMVRFTSPSEVNTWMTFRIIAGTAGVDGEGGTEDDVVTISEPFRLVSVDQTPVAVAGDDMVGIGGVDIQLDGSGSYPAIWSTPIAVWYWTGHPDNPVDPDNPEDWQETDVLYECDDGENIEEDLPRICTGIATVEMPLVEEGASEEERTYKFILTIVDSNYTPATDVVEVKLGYQSCNGIMVGDCNADGYHNVLDTVVLGNCVLTDSCKDDAMLACTSDVNFNGGWNVLDIVILANCVLADSCQDTLGGWN